MHRLRAPLSCSLALALLVTACGGESPATGGDDPWPLRVPVSGVIGYASLELPADATRELLTDLVGSAPLALADGRLVLLAFDPLALGGAAGLVLPLADEEAFLASLELMPQVEPLGDGRLRLRLAPDAGLAMAIAAYASFTAESSALGMLGAVGSLGPQVLTVYVDVRDGRACIVPTFEAAASARRACDAIAGLAEPGRAVLTLDTERVVVAYRDALENTRRRVLGALGTAEGLMSRRDGPDGAGAADDLEQQLFQRARGVLEAIEIGGDDILGVQFRARPRPGIPAVGAFEGDPLEGLGTLEFRFAWSDASSLGRLLQGLRPVPGDTDAFLVVRLDPEAVTLAGDPELATLVELSTGASAGTVAALEQLLGDLLFRMEGLLAVLAPVGTEGPVLAFTLRPGADLDWRELAASLATAWPEADMHGARWLAIADDAWVLVDEGGARMVTLGVRDGVAWVGSGERIRSPTEACAALAAGARRPPADGPVLLVDQGDVQSEMSVHGREAVVRMRFGGESDDGR